MSTIIFENDTLRVVQYEQVRGKMLLATATQLVLAQQDHSLHVWDRERQAVQHVLVGHGGDIYAACLSPDGRTLATASEDRTARLWDMATGRLSHTLRGHGDIVKALVFSPDSQQLYTSGGGVWYDVGALDSSIRVWDVQRGEAIGQFAGHGVLDVSQLVLTPDGQHLVSVAGRFSSLEASTWHLTTRERVAKMDTGNWRRWSFGITPDGLHAVFSLNAGTLSLWDTLTGQQLYEIDQHERINELMVTRALHVVGALHNNTLRVWDMPNTRELLTIRNTEKISEMTLFRDDRLLIVGLMENELRLYDLTDGTLVTRQPTTAPALPIRLAPDERWAAFTNHLGQITIIEQQPTGADV